MQLSLKSTRRARLRLFAMAIALVSSPAQSAVVANDGGVTLWISYDNLDAPGTSLADNVTEANSSPAGGGSCGPTNGARSAAGEPNSPASCPGGTGTCTGEEKFRGDLEKLADYIFQATEGAHYLRRVYVSDEGRAWTSADIAWNVGVGLSSSPFGWANSDVQLSMMSAYRTCIHEVVHHELGHYFYHLPDRYAKDGGYYTGAIGGGASFDVDVTTGDPNTVMSSNFPHVYVDTTNASITADFDPPDAANVVGAVLTPNLLSDGDGSNDGPDRTHHGYTHPFAQDEWVRVPTIHADLSGVHTEGGFADPGTRPPVDIVIVGDDEPHPGFALVLDRSGSMGVTTNGVTAAQYVQEAGMFLYHSADPADIVGTYLYNDSVEELFDYAAYDATNDLPFVSFRTASGLTDIAEALERAIDELIAFHGEGGVSGAEIYLMSDGKQTTGDSIWDQVTRANERGIKINTFMFGDADETTMQSIADGSSGSVTTMSELNDASELKMIMTRKFETGRGRTPIFTFKGPFKDRINLGATSVTGGEFMVPPKSRDIQFYAFQRTGDASSTMTIQLESPSGATFTSPAPNNVAQKGRFNGVEVDKPEVGLWKYRIAGVPGTPLSSEPVELAVYADNPELKGTVWFEDFLPSGAVPVRARLVYRYPLTRIKVSAKLYSGGDFVGQIAFFDDGVGAGDAQASDGIYSALIDFATAEGKRIFRSIKTPKLRVEAEFDVGKSSRPAPNVQYEPGSTMAMVDADYQRGNVATFKAWATGVLNLREKGQADKNRPRLVRGAATWPVKATPGKQGSFFVTIVNARPLASQLRISLGEGVRVRATPVKPRKPLRESKEGAQRDALPTTRESIDETPKKVAGAEERSRQPEPLSANYRIDFVVDKEAAPGARTLKAQYSEAVLELTDAIIVAK